MNYNQEKIQEYQDAMRAAAQGYANKRAIYCRWVQEQLEARRDPPDKEDAHIEADNLLCALIGLTGWSEEQQVIAAYLAVPKWYG